LLARLAAALRGMMERPGEKIPESLQFFESRTSHDADDLRIFRSIRDPSRPPAIIIHGVMPRSGTVYLGELLRLHPQILAFPKEVWEFPFLSVAGDLIAAQEKFFTYYRQNRGKIDERLFLPLFGSAMIRYLGSFAPENRRVLLKVPDVSWLHLFEEMFPNERAVVLMRDGRDVVHSTLKTWPERGFERTTRLWHQRATLVREHQRHYAASERLCYVKFEDVLRDPAATVRAILSRFDVPIDEYPFGEIDSLPVRGSSATGEAGSTHVTWKPVERPSGFRPVGRWSTWTRRDKRTFKSLAGQTLIDWGYATDLDW